MFQIETSVHKVKCTPQTYRPYDREWAVTWQTGASMVDTRTFGDDQGEAEAFAETKGWVRPAEEVAA